MAKQRAKQSNVQLIIGALMTGKPLKSKEISGIISQAAGKRVKVQDVASMLSRISNEAKCDLGHFILKEPRGNSFIYRVVDDFLKLSVDQAYGLTLKTGKNRYPLDRALTEYPQLLPYVRRNRSRKAADPQSAVPGGRRNDRKKMEASPAPASLEAREFRGLSGQSLADLQQWIDKARDLKEMLNLNINVNVTFKFEGFGD